MMRYLAWVEGLRGPTAQLWPEKRRSATTGKPEPYLALHELKPEEQSLPLAMLEARYPYTPKAEDAEA